jgi:hypothetical protein
MKTVASDLFNSGFKENMRDLGGLIFNGALGYVESWCAPLTAPRIARETRKELNRDKISIYNLACHGAEALFYTAGMISHIERIANNPEDWKSWIPVATNLVGRTAGYVYNNYDTIFGNEELGHVSRYDVRSATEKPGDSEAKPGERVYYE